MLDPTIGRWMTEDPSGFEAADPNLYRYVENNPPNLTDPSGLQPPTQQGGNRVGNMGNGGHDPTRGSSLPGRGFVGGGSPADHLAKPGPPITRVEVMTDARAFWDKGLKSHFSLEVEGAKEEISRDSGFSHYSMGCVGLCSLRMGFEKASGILYLEGTRCFKDLKSAQEYLSSLVRQGKKNARLFAVQTEARLRTLQELKEQGLEPFRKNRLPNEIDPRQIVIGFYNFATWHEPRFGYLPYWEWMSHGLNKPDAVVNHDSFLPGTLDDQELLTTVYCVIEARRSTLLPPANHDR